MRRSVTRVTVVARAARRRRAVAVVVALLVAALPAAATAGAGLLRTQPTAATPAPRDLLASIRASDTVPHSGLVEARAAVGLPDLPRLGRVARLLGGTTRARVWWGSPTRWRVDRLTATGEHGLYAAGRAVAAWDYEDAELRFVVGEPQVRLPRVDDLLPPQAARRLVGGVGPADTVEAVGRSCVAGRATAGVRVVPADPAGTLGRVDVWVDEATGLPLRLDVLDRAGQVSLTTRFLDVSLGPPDPDDLAVPEAPGAEREVTSTPDLAAAVADRSAFPLPRSLAGLPASTPPAAGTQQYGDGLARLVLLPLPGHLTRDIYRGARDAGGQELDVPGGRVVLLRRGVVSAAVVRQPLVDHEHGFLLAGLVTPQTLETAARDLLADPPRRRDRS